jgi:hypothetical protein
MAETIKSVLFLDYDSVRRALEADDRKAAERIGLRVPAWIAAIEAGTLLGDEENPVRRRVLMRRCYADPTLLGSDRSAFLTNGFQVVDCPTAEGRDRNAAPIHMVLDTIDALDHPAGYEEFVLLSADTDLSPILIRLRAHNRSTAIYSNPVTADSYKAIADAMIDEDALVEIILSDERPKGATDAPPAPQPAERSEIESLARKVSTATSVPLFAPRTFAELFRQLVEEIAEKSYHHQTTAENVAARMASGGRNVTRRQVVFVVKGLALKGHVFSTNDTPERLAEVFREQVLYLCESAQMNLSDREKQILASWIVGRVQPAGAAAETEIAEAPAAETPPPARAAEAAKPAPKPLDAEAARNARRGKQPVRPAPAPTPAPKAEAAPIVTPPPKPPVEPPKPAPAAAKPAEPVATPPKQAEPAQTPPPSAKPAEEPKAPVRTILSPKTGAGPAKPGTATKPPLIPARTFTAPAKPAATPPAAASSRPASAPTAKPAAPARPVQPPRATAAPVVLPVEDDEKDAVESSILAAIAQAVDVLVEDSGVRPKPQSTGAAAAPVEAAPAAPAQEEPAPPPPPEEEEVLEGDDIGDEIQRIIASYNRNREK